MDPKPDPTEALLAKIRAAQAEIGGRVEELRAEGFEPGDFPEDCERMAAVRRTSEALPRNDHPGHPHGAAVVALTITGRAPPTALSICVAT